MATTNTSSANNSKHINNKNKSIKILVNVILYGILLIGSIIVLYPFFFMLMNSFKVGPEIMNAPLALPKSINLGGYTEVFNSLNIPRLFFNTIVIASSVTVLNVLFSSMVAYAIVKQDVPYKRLTRNIILASMMIPSVLLLIPTYTMMFNWNWIDTYRVLIIPVSLSAYNIFLMIQFFTQIDDAYLEAARIDGANEFTIFTKVVLPMAKPALATIGILAFMGSWNDFLNPLLYLRSDTKFTLQIAIFKFRNAIPGVHIEQLWAAMVLVSLPVVIIYFFMQKNFIKAFTGVGLK
jgi:multiple sugar transport system permease protein